MQYKNITGTFFGLVTKHACDRRTDGRTDRQTDGQNYDSQDRASIAESRGKNYSLVSGTCLFVWQFGPVMETLSRSAKLLYTSSPVSSETGDLSQRHRLRT